MALLYEEGLICHVSSAIPKAYPPNASSEPEGGWSATPPPIPALNH